MKFNTTYKPKISFNETIKEIAKIKQAINDHMLSKYDLTNVTPPTLSEEDNDVNINFELKTRSVTFESQENKIHKLFLSHSNWVRELLRRINVKHRQGVFFEASTIWRDIDENTVTTITHHDLTYAFCIPRKNIGAYVKSLTHELYDLIYKIALRIKKDHKISNIFPVQPVFISSQQLENEMPNLTFPARENEIILEEQALFLTGVGTILFSGKRHAHIPVQFYDLQHFNQIIMFDRNNAAPLKVASIGLMASGKQLSKQLTLYGHSEIASLPFYQPSINDHQKYIEIKINLPRLAMVLLAKGHIGEVQAGVTSNESKTVKHRYGIEIY